jgi:HK97 family phage major capsid protein
MTLEQMRARLAEVEDRARAIDTEAGDNALTTEQRTEFDALIAERQQLQADIAAEERRIEARTALAGAAGGRGRVEDGDGARSAPRPPATRDDPFAVLEDRSLNPRERRTALIDSTLRAVEGRIERAEDQAHFERILRRHADDTAWAENLLARSRPAYADGFAKLMTGRSELLTEEERAAVAIGTTTQGGYLVPTHLDPTLILTNDGSSNVLRSANTRKVTLTEGNVWYGVTSAGVTASWDAELTEVSDDSPTVAQASITCYKAQAFVQASIEAFEDIAGLASDVLMLLGDARDRLEGAAHMVGSGSQPQGLFTVINASASLRTTSTTAATIGEVDIHALYRALPVRWRGRGTFVANPLYLLAIKRLGTAVSSAFSGDLTQPVTDRILGRPVLESDDAPTTQTTTALDQEVVFSDLSQFTIVDKPGGVSVEFIPHLFNTANNLPDGRRGWYMHWRNGSGQPALAAGRILVDKTSA